jgi:ABC-type nitrate/sulfonate/bicarbonate transport system substrate-binding protein
MGREILRTANLTQDDAQFISQGTAGRLPGFLAGQIEGVALHPEDVFLVQQKKPGARILTQLSDCCRTMPSIITAPPTRCSPRTAIWCATPSRP